MAWCHSGGEPQCKCNAINKESQYTITWLRVASIACFLAPIASRLVPCVSLFYRRKKARLSESGFLVFEAW